MAAIRPSPPHAARGSAVRASEVRRFREIFISEDDKATIERLALRYTERETGGDLFGSWHDDGNTAVVRLVIGPGKQARGHTTSFFQDKGYLEYAGGIAVNELQLQQIGQWHSHHQIALPRPSAGDEDTMASVLAQIPQYIMLIVTFTWNPDLTNFEVVLNPFCFRRGQPSPQPAELVTVSRLDIAPPPPDLCLRLRYGSENEPRSRPGAPTRSTQSLPSSVSLPLTAAPLQTPAVFTSAPLPATSAPHHVTPSAFPTPQSVSSEPRASARARGGARQWYETSEGNMFVAALLEHCKVRAPLLKAAMMQTSARLFRIYFGSRETNFITFPGDFPRRPVEVSFGSGTPAGQSVSVQALTAADARRLVDVLQLSRLG